MGGILTLRIFLDQFPEIVSYSKRWKASLVITQLANHLPPRTRMYVFSPCAKPWPY